MIPKVYEPSQVKGKWYKHWLERGYFAPDVKSAAAPYCIVIPPPNVTGSLHIGHALNHTLQDILIRWHRMRGDSTLWVFGTDHAGIATQNVVERELAKEGLRRQDLGRERFVERVWKWKEHSGGTIKHQAQQLGISADFSRERFTMDAGLSKAVQRVFLELYQQGLIYRGQYITNWCPRCRTALSDLEVEYEQLQGHLYYLKYPLADSEGYLVVATTRPETMLGDTAVAVHPDDERFRQYIGQEVILPLMERRIPVVADSFVDPQFGTGSVKITPAHDPNDFEVARRHNLPQVVVMNLDATMNEQAGKYAGMDRYQCRNEVLKDLKAADLVVKIEPHLHAVGHCYRCKTVVEPIVSKQWFVRMKELAEPAIKAVEEGRVRIIPSSWESTYFEWMHNIRDWCISRQIWWGHRIPVWYCQSCGEIIPGANRPAGCPKCQSQQLEPETDVLDTWFSSALWPFSTLGWPDWPEPELKHFYPNAALVTSFDILFFWVARMIMMGLKFMGDVPFRDVYIHALVRDAQGQKMSKSKGNVIDPLDFMGKYGTDSFRFTLAALTAQGRDICLSEERVQGYRNFINKIWNAARLVLMNVEGDLPLRRGGPLCPPLEGDHPPNDDSCTTGGGQGRPPLRSFTPLPESEWKLTLADKWIIHRLAQVVANTDQALKEYRFNEYANGLYDFFWHDFCDWYLELIKPQLSDPGTQNVLVHLLETILRLLHPVIPFITEEIWQTLPVHGESITLAPWPKAEDVPGYRLVNAEDRQAASAQMELIQQVISWVRNIKAEMNIAPATRLDVYLRPHQPGVQKMLEEHRIYIETLARTNKLEIEAELKRPAKSACAVIQETDIFIDLKDINLAEEERRIEKEINRLRQDLSKIEGKLANQDFLRKAPPQVVDEQRRRGEELQFLLTKLEASLHHIREWGTHGE